MPARPRARRRAARLLALAIAIPAVAVPATGSTAAGGFAARLAATAALPDAARAAAADSLWRDLPGGATPVVEDSTAHFLFWGEAATVAVAGDMTQWKPALAMQRMPGTSLWHAAFTCPLDSRLDYKLIVDGGQWLQDPLNPRAVTGGFGPNSELAMPAYVDPPEQVERDLPPCTLHSFADFESPELGNERQVWVVLPPGYDPERTYPLLVVHDGREYIGLGKLPRVLAHLAATRPELRLPVCVCVAHVERGEEYGGAKQEAYGRFIVETLLPFVTARYAVSMDPADRGSMGASAGGHVSVYLAGRYPEQFQGLVLMSPYIPDAKRALFALRAPADCRVYLNWGRWDLPEIPPLAEAFAAMLAERGIAHEARVCNEGHSWGLWRATIDEGLLVVFGER
ncbi:MAG: hypothetical protein JW819_02180 [Candidatus Krumholzibacteriota bacterium]|nr:hypothetical protein [Candidatus Krumholzibacteriota bacterium]